MIGIIAVSLFPYLQIRSKILLCLIYKVIRQEKDASRINDMIHESQCLFSGIRLRHHTHGGQDYSQLLQEHPQHLLRQPRDHHVTEVSRRATAFTKPIRQVRTYSYFFHVLSRVLSDDVILI